MNSLRLAVIGGGHLGKIHVRLARELPDVELLAVVEPDAAAARRLEDEFNCRVVDDVAAIERAVDAAIIAAPTQTHFQIATGLLSKGVHTFVEKPITTTAPQADHLIHLAERNHVVLQVGHVERFNPAFEQAAREVPVARFFEATRASVYTFRSTDVGVVHDMMIHDIDLVCSLTRSPLVDARATGVAVFGPHEDIAEARLEFADGTVASLRASRCSFQAARQVAWYGEKGYVSADLAAGRLQTVGLSPLVDLGSHRNVEALGSEPCTAIREDLFGSVLPRKTHEVKPQNAIAAEQRDFLQAIRTGQPPRVSGRDGRRAVSIAQAVVESINEHRWADGSGHRVGAQTQRLSILPAALRYAG